MNKRKSYVSKFIQPQVKPIEDSMDVGSVEGGESPTKKSPG